MLIIGISTFISKINTPSESLKACEVIIFQHFDFYEQVKISCSVEMSMKKVLISGSVLLLKMESNSEKIHLTVLPFPPNFLLPISLVIVIRHSELLGQFHIIRLWFPWFNSLRPSQHFLLSCWDGPSWVELVLSRV